MVGRPTKKQDLEKEACYGVSCRSPVIRHKFLSIAALLFSILVGLLCQSLSSSHDYLDRPIPREAIPLWQTSELHWAVRFFFGYFFDRLFPVALLLKCPTTVDWTNVQEADEAKSCMNPVRAILEKADEFVDLNSLFNVQVINIERPGGGDNSLVRVTLLKKKSSSATVTKTYGSAAPLILYLHGGGFTVRGGKGSLAAQIFGHLLQLDKENDDVNDSVNPFMDDAVWAIVDYRLAPEHKYPAATEDCLLALNHLVYEMNFGRGGIHISGVSAGATLAMEVTLKSMNMNIDSFYVDEPMIPLPSKDGNQTTWSFDSDSFRRYAYSRIPPVAWIEWSLKAMTGMETKHDVESNLAYGMITTDVDITGGSIDAAKWKQSFDESNSTQLPRLFLLTANGDPLKDGGVYFNQIYEQVIGQVEAAAPNKTERQPQIKYIETSSGHTGHYIFEQPVFKDVMREWYAEMKKAYSRKLNNGL
jgi:acetyl esterase/lipase